MLSYLSPHWLGLTLTALVLYGLAQGFMRLYIEDVPPARFCLYALATDAVVNVSFILYQHLAHTEPWPFAPEGRPFLFFALLSGLLGGASSILYFESVAGGPISIVGTVSATYPAWTAVIARFFLAEHLSSLQYVGVVVVILGCMGVAHEPSDPREKTTNRLWFLQANLAALGWGISGVVTDHAYELPNASEANLVLFSFLGGMLTLGPYGLLRSRGRKFSRKEFTRGALPMGMFTVGNLLLTFAFRHGDATLVQTLSSPYPAITLVFAFIILKERPTFLQWVCIVLILVGMVLCPGMA